MADYDDPLFDDPAWQNPAGAAAEFSDPRFFDEAGFDELPPGASGMDDFTALFGDMQKEFFSDMKKEMAIEWIRENHTAAILGAFAVGVFMGVLMRR